MKWTLTTATYRFHLHAFTEIAAKARGCGFEAIELWEPHLVRHREEIERYQLDDSPIPIHVLSGYSDVTGTTLTTEHWSEQLRNKLESCQRLGIPYLRLFTGNLSSREAEERDWLRFIRRVGHAQEMAEQYKCQIVFETHPGTLLDQADGVERFLACIEQFQWSRVGLNFDAFHVWEFGASPIACLRDWYPYIKHVHVKSARKKTTQFHFDNVYHPAGRFDDLCSIYDGVYAIEPILHALRSKHYGGALTLEWFGLPNEQFFRDEIQSMNTRLINTKELSV